MAEKKVVDDVTTQRLRAPIEIDFPEEVPSLPSQAVHLLPCHIQTSQNYAAVSTYFVPRKAEASTVTEPLWEAQFRGRDMTGVPVQCPPGMTGYVLKSADEGADRRFNVTHSFDEIIMWNRDKNKEERNFLKQTITEWPDIAHALHDPIESV